MTSPTPAVDRVGYEQSGKLSGKIVALTEPNDKRGKPKVCIACTGADKRKPIGVRAEVAVFCCCEPLGVSVQVL